MEKWFLFQSLPAVLGRDGTYLGLVSGLPDYFDDTFQWHLVSCGLQRLAQYAGADGLKTTSMPPANRCVAMLCRR